MTQSNLVPLGDYIIQCDERNSDGALGVESVRGLSTTKEIIETKANMDGVSLTSYKLVKKHQFAFVPDTSRRGDKMSLGFNCDDETYLVSSISCVFKVKDESVLIPSYLYVFFCRPEFDRYARFHSWGSAREAFSWEEMQRVMIPLPSIGEQRKIVDVWKGLRKVKEDNEKIAEPLFQLCQSYLQELKHKYPKIEIGPYIERIDRRNSGNKVGIVKSVSVTKEFNDTNAKVDKNNLSGYKIVEDGQISFVQTTGNEKCLCAAINHFGYPVVVTSVNEVFKTDSSKLLPDYLHLIFRSKETDRYARYHSWGSARETFTWEDMQRFKAAIPPIEVQEAVVNIYNCATEAKRLAAEADKQSRELCPALMQYIVNR